MYSATGTWGEQGTIKAGRLVPSLLKKGILINLIYSANHYESKALCCRMAQQLVLPAILDQV